MKTLFTTILILITILANAQSIRLESDFYQVVTGLEENGVNYTPPRYTPSLFEWDEGTLEIRVTISGKLRTYKVVELKANTPKSYHIFVIDKNTGKPAIIYEIAGSDFIYFTYEHVTFRLHIKHPNPS